MKYNQKNSKVLIDALKKTGRVTAACRAANISRCTFYQWIKEKPKFAKAVNEAKEGFFQVNEVMAARSLAMKKTLEVLADGSTETHTTKVIRKDKTGEIIFSEIKETTIKKDTPSWLLREFVGGTDDISNAIHTLVNSGFLPADVLAGVAESTSDWLAAVADVMLNSGDRTLPQLPNDDDEYNIDPTPVKHSGENDYLL